MIFWGLGCMNVWYGNGDDEWVDGGAWMGMGSKS